MSGLEAAGVILGAFPLLLDSIEHVRDAAKVGNFYWHIRKHYLKCRRDIQFHEIFYKQSLRELLLALIEDADEVARVVADPGDPGWGDAALQTRLEGRLHGSYHLYQSIFTVMNYVVTELRRELSLVEENIQNVLSPSGDLLSPSEQKGERRNKLLSLQATPTASGIPIAKGGWEYEMFRKKFSLWEEWSNELLNQLGRCNERLEKLLRSIDAVSACQRTTPERRTATVTNRTITALMLPIEQGKDYDNLVQSQLPYKLVENLGYGGSGYVEKVEDLLTGEQFARKVIPRRSERRFREKQTTVFRNEIKNIRRLVGHRHIVSLFATYATHEQFGLILQPVANDKDLGEYLANYRSAILAENSASPDPRVVKMTAVLQQAFVCLATGMSYMHTNKVRHKDVKPQNILMHNGQVVYTDFGCSFDSNGLSRSRTEGTPGSMTAKYSAPEVLEHEARDSSSDIYSLGCVFIQILSALTSASMPEIHDILSFAESMDDIHQHIVHWQTSPRTASLPAIITQMTTHNPSERLRAAQIANKIFRSSGLSCQECAMNSMYDT